MQPLRFCRRQGGGRLVEHDEVGLTGECPEDLHLLALPDAQASHAGIRRQVESRGGHDRLEARPEGTPVDDARPLWFDAQEHVLGDAELGHERQLLGHQRDALVEGLAW